MVILNQIRDALRLPRSGQFYTLSAPLTNAAVSAIFSAVVTDQNQRAPQLNAGMTAFGPTSPNSNIQFEELRSPHTRNIGAVNVDLHVSAFVRSYQHSPAFAPKSGLIEHSYDYIFLVEASIATTAGTSPSRYLFVQRQGAIDPLKHSLHSAASSINFPAFMEQFLAASPSATPPPPPRIERLAMRMMATSKGGVRQKTVESYDVAAATSSFGLHRTIPGAMTLTRDAGAATQQFLLSPHRDRVRKGSGRISYTELLTWLSEIVAGFHNSRNATSVSSPFLAQMAQPLLDLSAKIPSSLLIERRPLADAIEEIEAETNRAWTRTSKTPLDWQIDGVLASICEPIALDPQPRNRSGAAIGMTPLPREVCYFPQNPLPYYSGDDPLYLTVSSRSCKVHLPKGAGKLASGGRTDALSMTEVVNDIRSIRVIFDNGNALYCSEGAFKSSNTSLAIEQLIRIFHAVPALGGVITEKGKVRAAQTAFEATSSFHVIETDSIITDLNSTLICDDANDEWCDYIEINAASKRMRWLHSKVQPIETAASMRVREDRRLRGLAPGPADYGSMSLRTSLSASDLQEVVGQATKNLSKLRVTSRDPKLLERCERWRGEFCSLPSRGRISRLRRGTPADAASIASDFDSMAGDPNATYEIGLVIPNYSLSSMSAELARIQNGNASLYVVQAFWLLSGFMHSCLEVGARPMLFMQP